MLHAALTELLALLTIDPDPRAAVPSTGAGLPGMWRSGTDEFCGASKNEGAFGGGPRRYGGELLAQALRAGQQTADARPVNSLHAYFVRSALKEEPVRYRVQRTRDGRSFASRRIDGSQNGTLVFSMEASFASLETGFEHQVAMPDVPLPEHLPGEDQRLAAARQRQQDRPTGWPGAWYESAVTTPGAFVVRYVEDLWEGGPLPPRMNVWVRAQQPVRDTALSAACALYFSDETIMDNALLPHFGRDYYGHIQAASLDHAMWFHRPFEIGDWHLFAQDSPIAHGARGLTRGHWFNRRGQLVASVAQEVLIRPNASAPGAGEPRR